MAWIKSERTANVVHWAEHWPVHGWLTGCGWSLGDGEVVIWVESLRLCGICRGHLNWRLSQVGLVIAKKGVKDGELGVDLRAGSRGDRGVG